MSAGPGVGDSVFVFVFRGFLLVLFQFLLVLLFSEVVPANTLPGWASPASTFSHGFLLSARRFDVDRFEIQGHQEPCCIVLKIVATLGLC